ncbi:hypothetical protein Tco_0741483, partial [Tanacetum coccineum]
DGENLDKIKEKGDLCIFVRYSTTSKGYRVYNKRTRLIVESVHINFDEIKEFSKASKLVPNVSPQADKTDSSQQELDFLFSPLFKEYFTTGYQSVPNSSSLFDNSQQQNPQPTANVQPITEPITLTIIVHAEENNTDQAKDAQFEPYEFIKPFSILVQELAESSSRNVDNSNMHTFYQCHRSDYHWTKDHPLEQVRGNPSKPVQTRRQLPTNP